jgi:hypothetical protein
LRTMLKNRLHLQLLCMCLGLICFSSCGSRRIFPTPAPSLALLERQFNAELQRLNIDPRRAAQAPTRPENAVFDLALEVLDPDGSGNLPPTSIELRWTERLLGDYNQDGLVSVNDLTPLGGFWNEPVQYDAPETHGGIPYWPLGQPDGDGTVNWRRARVDGNADGLITISELTPLAVHLGEALDGYVIERGINNGAGSIDWEDQPLDVGYGRTPSMPRLHAISIPNGPIRYSALVPLTSPELGQHFRVRAVHTKSATSGPESNIAYYEPPDSGDVVPPYWQGRAGLIDAVPYPGRLELRFGTAADNQSPPVAYNVYVLPVPAADWAGPFDYDLATRTTVVSAPYSVDGLTDGAHYAVAVRAEDSAGNEEQNDHFIVVAPGNVDIYPPVWQDTAGAVDVYLAPDSAIVGCWTAVDSTTVDAVTHASGPVAYRVYYGYGAPGDLSNAAVQQFTPAEAPFHHFTVTGIDAARSPWFMVRAQDASPRANEDENSKVIETLGFTVDLIDVPNRPDGIPATARFYQDGFVQSPDNSQLRYWQTWQDGLQWYLATARLSGTTLQPLTVETGQSPLGTFFTEYFLDNSGKLTIVGSTLEGLFGDLNLKIWEEGETPESYNLGPATVHRVARDGLGRLAVFYTQYTWNTSGPVPAIEAFRQRLFYPAEAVSYTLREQLNAESPRQALYAVGRQVAADGMNLILALGDPETEPPTISRLVANTVLYELQTVQPFNLLPYSASYGLGSGISDVHASYEGNSLKYMGVKHGETFHWLMSTFPEEHQGYADLSGTHPQNTVSLTQRQLLHVNAAPEQPYDLPVISTDFFAPDRLWILSTSYLFVQETTAMVGGNRCYVIARDVGEEGTAFIRLLTTVK